jgi:hypothetical protein
MRYSARLLAVLMLGLVVLALARLGIAYWLHDQFANSAADIAAVSGMDVRLAHWMQTNVAWIAGLGLFSIVWRWMIAVVWPFTPRRKIWKPALLLLVATGLGTGMPVLIGRIRHVDAAGRPERMEEIVNPCAGDWFTPDGAALLYYSREADGSLRFWNRPGMTPDHALQSVPVTPEVRMEWERQRAARAEQEKQRETQNAQIEAAQKQAAESEALRSQVQRLQQEAEKQKNHDLAEQETQRHQAEELQWKQQIEAMRAEVEALRTQAANDRPTEAEAVATPAPLTNDPRVLEASINDGGETRGLPEQQLQQNDRALDSTSAAPVNLEEAQPLAGSDASQSVVDYDRVYRLLPTLWLNVGVKGRPCTVWADIPFEIFPNNPSLPRRLVRAGECLHFPLLQGIGPTTLHARPENGAGIMYIRFDD